MIKPEYSPTFETFWQCLLIARRTMPWMRALGGKEEAFIQFKLLKIDESDIDYLTKQYINQGHAILKGTNSGDNPAPIKDICRWLKYRRFEDETCESGVTSETLPRSDQRKAAAAERYRLKHMARGVEPSGSDETCVGGVGQLNLGVLENKA